MTEEVAFKLEVGDLVIIFGAFTNKPEDNLGYIYELYKDFDNPLCKGVSIITEEGEDLGGFSFKEQLKFLEFSRKSDFKYIYSNVMQLRMDFNKGLFKNAF